MSQIIRFRWLVLLAWIICVTVLVLFAPNMENLVREKGQIKVPDGYPSTIGSKIIEEHNPKNENSNTVVLVFHEKKGFTNAQIAEVEKTFETLSQKRSELGINEITNQFNNPDLKDQLYSENRQTILGLLDVSFKGREVKEVRDKLEDAIKTDGVKTYMTGNNFISEDVIISSQNGLKKTELITLVFILVVLILVFRSFVAPFVPLITVGLTYVTSQAIVAFLVDRLNFPLSNFTQIFLVVILFGVGTDYCILLLTRFKEELSSEENIISAIIETYKTAGKTVLFSGLAVLAGFISIGFATFKLYQSAVGVAIGVAVLLIALMTIVPFFMAVLGKKLFWPVKGEISHSQSKLWGLAGKLSLSRPIVTLIIIGIIVTPLLIKYDGSLSFNSLDEIGENYNSVKGFNIIADNFGPGEALPAKVVIENDENMKNSEYLNLVEKITREIENVDDIEKVRSATRPVGDQIKDFYVNNQANQLKDGLTEGNNGITTIKNGLSSAANSINSSKPQMNQAVSSVSELVNGTNQLKSGVTDLKNGLIQIETGLKQGTVGLGQLKSGLNEAKISAGQLSAGQQQLSNGYHKAADGMNELYQNYQKVENGLNELQSNVKNLDKPLQNIESNGKYPGIESDPDFGIIKQTIAGVNQSFPSITVGLKNLNQNFALLSQNIAVANKSMNEITLGQLQLTAGFDQFINAVDQLEKGVDAAGQGQGKIISEVPKIEHGLDGIAGGQTQLQNGFSELVSQLDQLQTGLNDSSTGLNQIGNGLTSATDYLEKLSSIKDSELSGFYIPDDVVSSQDFSQVFNTYMSEDGKVTTMDVILKVNPYSNEALTKVADLKEAVNRAVKGTKLEKAEIGVTGVTSINHDLKNISDADYSRTVLLMLVGIGVILVLLLKSLIMPIYLIVSLIITYFSSLSITELIFVNILGYPGLNWSVPFFGFVILMALGVDYSIFLMDRFNEYKDMKIEKALMLSMRNMGTVIISAVIILSGTFAAMLPSGVLSLLQISTLVLAGLLFYAFIILPLFVPVVAKLFGRANWWPFFIQK
ncbi:MMPL family transporter [Bacillus sp. 03113]|uniref:MMPL family transporter n=1 Tax=Bacillus sp. 03113 TaxID=2578211 RepID=UPI001144F494|nr:MMPL family transporter [Bacillus sp. 03113]